MSYTRGTFRIIAHFAEMSTTFFATELLRKEKRPAEANLFYGAGDEARTRYLHLGKVALYRMSYTRIYYLKNLR